MISRVTRVPQSSRFLSRILELPELAREVQRLEPKILHQLIRKCGLEDSGEIIALATTGQLMRVFDDDLWRSDRAGAEERFDADRFGIWLEVLAEMGADVAALKIAGMDFDFITAAVSQQILVLDQEGIFRGRASARIETDECDPMEETWPRWAEKAVENSLKHEFNGYQVISRRDESWDAMLSVLVSLEDTHHDFFRRLMDRCQSLSAEYIEDDGGLFEVLTASEQVMEDAASDREQRRKHEGYVAPAQATAFLTLARQPCAEDFGRPPVRDHVTTSYFRGIQDRAEEGGKRGSARRQAGRGREPRASRIGGRESGLLDVLRETGIIPKSPPALLPSGEAAEGNRKPLIKTQLSYVREHDEPVYSRRLKELGYLANILMAGCSFQSRRFRAVEAADAVFASCNLGLANWPRHWLRESSRSAPGTVVEAESPALRPDFLIRNDLVTAFKVGWSCLHERVSLHVGRHLVTALAEMECDDRELQDDLGELARRLELQVKAGTPWRERDNMDVLAILDQPAWAVLLGLLDECPVVPKVADYVTERLTTEFEFIAENHQIRWAQAFARDLPRRLLE